jgi:hypothetical protein
VRSSLNWNLRPLDAIIRERHHTDLRWWPENAVFGDWIVDVLEQLL